MERFVELSHRDRKPIASIIEQNVTQGLGYAENRSFHSTDSDLSLQISLGTADSQINILNDHQIADLQEMICMLKHWPLKNTQSLNETLQALEQFKEAVS